MMRFVVIATMRRGPVEPFEPLDADGQGEAIARFAYESAMSSERVVWSDRRGPESAEREAPGGSNENGPRVKRMVELARKASAA